MLSFVFRQIHPQQALTTLRRLPFLKSREVAESLEDTLVDTEVFDLAPNTARALMVDQLPTVGIDDPVEAVRNSVRELGELRNKLTYVYVPMSEMAETCWARSAWLIWPWPTTQHRSGISLHRSSQQLRSTLRRRNALGCAGTTTFRSCR